jgi:hypothetical protein
MNDTNRDISLSSASFIGLKSTEGSIFYKDSLEPDDVWTMGCNQYTFNDICQFNTGDIYAIATDNNLYKIGSRGIDLFTNKGRLVTATRIPEFSKGVINDQGTVGDLALISITQLTDGTFIGINTNGSLYTKQRLVGEWFLPVNSVVNFLSVSQNTSDIPLRAIDQLQNGSLVCIGKEDNALYVKTSINSIPTLVDNSVEILDVCINHDDSILAINKETASIIYRASLDIPWSISPLENSGIIQRLSTFYVF